MSAGLNSAAVAQEEVDEPEAAPRVNGAVEVQLSETVIDHTQAHSAVRLKSTGEYKLGRRVLASSALSTHLRLSKLHEESKLRMPERQKTYHAVGRASS